MRNSADSCGEGRSPQFSHFPQKPERRFCCRKRGKRGRISHGSWPAGLQTEFLTRTSACSWGGLRCNDYSGVSAGASGLSLAMACQSCANRPGGYQPPGPHEFLIGSRSRMTVIAYIRSPAPPIQAHRVFPCPAGALWAILDDRRSEGASHGGLRRSWGNIESRSGTIGTIIGTVLGCSGGQWCDMGGGSLLVLGSTGLKSADSAGKVVGRGRIELPTPGFSVLCSTN